MAPPESPVVAPEFAVRWSHLEIHPAEISFAAGERTQFQVAIRRNDDPLSLIAEQLEIRIEGEHLIRHHGGLNVEGLAAGQAALVVQFEQLEARAAVRVLPPTPPPPAAPAWASTSTESSGRGVPSLRGDVATTEAPPSAPALHRSPGLHVRSSDDDSAYAWRFIPDVAGDQIKSLRNCPAVDLDGRLIACVQQEIVAFDWGDESVEIAWQYPTGSCLLGSPAIGSDQVIRAHGADGLLHRLTSDGRPAGPAVPIGEALGWAAPLADGDVTWISRYEGGLWRVAADGTCTRFLRSDVVFDSVGFIREGVLYIGGNDKFVAAINVSGQRATWHWPKDRDAGAMTEFINAAPLLLSTMAGPRVFAVDGNQRLAAFDLQGRRIWQTTLDGRVLGSPVGSVGRIYCGIQRASGPSAPGGALVCVDAVTGRIVWEYAASHPVESTPVIGDDDAIYFGDQGGAIHAVDTRGQARWTYPAGSPVRSAGALLPGGKLVFGLDDGSLLGLRCDSKRLAAGWPKLFGGSLQSGRVDAVAS